AEVARHHRDGGRRETQDGALQRTDGEDARDGPPADDRHGQRAASRWLNRAAISASATPAGDDGSASTIGLPPSATSALRGCRGRWAAPVPGGTSMRK